MRISVARVAMVLIHFYDCAGTMRQCEAGDLITPDNSAQVADMVSPGDFILVEQGMRIRIVSARIWMPIRIRFGKMKREGPTLSQHVGEFNRI
jgi:hypothetical protein